MQLQIWRKFLGLHNWRQRWSWSCYGSLGSSSLVLFNLFPSDLLVANPQSHPQPPCSLVCNHLFPHWSPWLVTYDLTKVAKQGLNIVLVARNKVLFVWPRAKYAQEIPSETEVAPRYRLLTLFRTIALYCSFVRWLGHQELKNIAHKGLWELYSVIRQTDGWDGTP